MLAVGQSFYKQEQVLKDSVKMALIQQQLNPSMKVTFKSHS